MNAITKDRMARDLSSFHIDIQDAISFQAAESARLCLENGWDPNGAAYDLTSMPGDLQALEELLGRKATREETRGLELSIRHCIAEARDA